MLSCNPRVCIGCEKSGISIDRAIWVVIRAYVFIDPPVHPHIDPSTNNLAALCRYLEMIWNIRKGTSLMKDSSNLRYGSSFIKELLLIKDGWNCFYCGRPFSLNMDGWNNMTIDHVNPQAKAVDENVHNINNLRIACKNCNSAKSDKLIEGDNLEAFRKQRTVIRNRDDRFVTERFEFIQEAVKNNSYNKLVKTWSNPDEYINDFKHAIIDAFSLDTNEISIDTYQGNKYLYFYVDGKGWTYTPCFFGLQAHFIFAWENSGKGIDSTIDNILKTMGYISEPDWRTKYLKPFFTIEGGICIIKKEITAVNRVWEMAKSAE
jgi:hypothetical protein